MKHPTIAAPTTMAAPPTTMVVYSDPSNQYLHFTPAAPPNQQPPTPILDTVSNLGKKLKTTIDTVYNHLRTNPSVANAAVTRLAQETRVLAEGGHEMVFWQTFGVFPAEKLRKTYACYISTMAGPVMGTLYISTHRIAFCSHYPLRRSADTYLPSAPGSVGKQQNTEWVYYKVVIMIQDVMAVDGVANGSKPSERYIKVLTRNGHEFWFMGFISYDKALKNLRDRPVNNFVY
ncbi:GEM-like protein [Drosera capensis]